ncbi:ATP-binding cassette domain-containing protein [Roseobacter sp. HKCCD9010]|uniref:ABC transporter ATP-binding protein n=2 Tax=unclassified Roseobacter TaxID=196798 RepID=UPI001492FEF8|nr:MULTISPECIES: ABC transporter ATP-binding protein [unclassified Roseobacter]MBF9051737.1 ATP-binding cassette domain-containing protein [Rhodobacterales bacterium HKCCD4356]NNV13730.1 ATP-binding cassette domain-containing protein [Roseobacter sp. HKCCD7357]NNV40282.1 ATP-binding cassette domain-containing protein [Roseobacter sp. HKCCD9054]NNV44374.1 ATP-binding cassette domain-containing protein [Roseobacter sp. HKCCD6497]NNV48815.1 ATP-binding cassette domain-containing protein [Roseobac
MLEMRNLTVVVGDTPVLSDIDLSLPEGELHVLLGPNGSGKSSLLASIMGLPPYEVVAGEILYDGQPIQALPLNERAALGIGLAYQRPPSLDGVTLKSFATALGAADRLGAEAEALDLTDFLGRDINVGFSGGEIKRWEVLKLVLQDPRLLLFDEPESGVDLEHVIAVGEAIARAVRSADRSGSACSGLVITHTGLILNHVKADRAHILQGGRILHSGDPQALFAHIQSHGYSAPAA